KAEGPRAIARRTRAAAPRGRVGPATLQLLDLLGLRAAGASGARADGVGPGGPLGPEPAAPRAVQAPPRPASEEEEEEEEERKARVGSEGAPRWRPAALLASRRSPLWRRARAMAWTSSSSPHVQRRAVAADAGCVPEGMPKKNDLECAPYSGMRDPSANDWMLHALGTSDRSLMIQRRSAGTCRRPAGS
ncbi:unnamed protein product, partial [Prorocentrum cordatum]